MYTFEFTLYCTHLYCQIQKSKYDIKHDLCSFYCDNKAKIYTKVIIVIFTIPESVFNKNKNPYIALKPKASLYHSKS